MKDLFLLDAKIGKKNKRLGRLKKFEKVLIEKVERDEKKRAGELAEWD